MVLNQLLQKLKPQINILEATFGLEREGLRITGDGELAQTPHPENFGSRSYHPYIQTDFSEQQLELITPISPSTVEARRKLSAIFDVTHRSLTNNEVVWPLSMPPIISEDQVTIAQLENPDEVAYRQQLADNYGKTLQSISGIHYNFELGKHLVTELFQASDNSDMVSFKNQLYMSLARNFLNYQWLITYLFGATPLAEKGFYSDMPQQLVRSFRASKQFGYANDASVQISFASIEDYVHSMETAIQSGALSLEKEFYSPVRLRGSQFCRDYLDKGISYIEFRHFDIDPFDPLGISQETLDSFHLILIALLWIDDFEDSHHQLAQATQLNETTALAQPWDKVPENSNAQTLIQAMQEVIDHFNLDGYYTNLVKKMCQALEDPNQTIAAKLATEIQNASLMEFGVQQAKVFHQQALLAPFGLQGYEAMELSTQMLMFDAIQKGIHLEVMDENDQFLKLWHKDHVEYVKNGNMTSKDRYIVPLAMANKTITKKILDQAGFPTPAGEEFASIDAALAYYSQIAEKPIVVKPKSTNFGLGISIFEKGANLEDYQKALEIAFKEDSDVLVESFISGTEYRFFVLEGKCQAVLLRLAANVVGDGKHSIQELIVLKNQNPLRGLDHRSPLEKIQLGDIERLMMAQEGYTANDILPEGVRLELRRNSNISTGGDSVDMTDTMDQSYKDLAAQMADAMGAWVCGVDLIIPDRTQISSKEAPNCHCIELNFNPSMYMHSYCQEGPGQAITPRILQALFPEVPIFKQD